MKTFDFFIEFLISIVLESLVDDKSFDPMRIKLKDIRMYQQCFKLKFALSRPEMFI